MTETISAAEWRASPTAKKSKYGNKRVLLDGITFDSKAEAKYYSELKIRERAAEIFDVELQRPFDLTIGGFLICTYRCDFSYVSQSDGKFHVVDVKGVRTREFIIKKKLMKAILDIVVEEVRA
jgi:hypothetical protein